ncbi:hypothetical protein BDZ94DRAFT_1284663 [Collybia nuda]|uniref:ATP-dependent DNA helicase n=1 Tax=Collybia nuda TaxID=64659 RepID=A0A9P6CFC1_9AGAR|nr:hypothetical protein BDZ94DRAFT_1284663 [Collybia nuda]
MIFAGDFAQLPPVIGGEHASLYSRTVGSKSTTLSDQEATIGKAIWHQITTVVILRTNMRQIHQTSEDTKFRHALENMRYKACTAEDIAFLKTRVSITDKNFRHVSIITRFNVHKDAINIIGSNRFALETNQSLTHFYSEDTISTKNESQDQKKATQKNGIPDNIQKWLWSQPACANSKLVPGRLSLCIGLPIIIRHNSATELCITNGQEGFVYSWDATIGSKGQKLLETLFVKLKNPPQTVQIEGLPENVVPLVRTTVSTSCSLPNDQTIFINRSQVEVLPNYGMTDYASQGKTRPKNVVDLHNLSSHQAYYTALSRSATAEGTLILQGFDAKKIVGKASGALRQEFRELELLDTITLLRFTGKLPKGMHDACFRNTLIDSFRKLSSKASSSPFGNFKINLPVDITG